MTTLTTHLHLPHPRRPRIPRQTCVAATCTTTGCRHAGHDLLPSLSTCPACGNRLIETRAAVTP
jgi:hypothetical protein